VTDYAQDQLGDIVFVQLPDVGEEVTAGQACGELESTKSVSDLYAPVSGKVTARNDAVLDAPEKVNADPYGDGWLFDVVPSDTGAVDGLLSAADYQAEIS
jgi:glycine cleavage system H protein